MTTTRIDATRAAIVATAPTAREALAVIERWESESPSRTGPPHASSDLARNAIEAAEAWAADPTEARRLVAHGASLFIGGHHVPAVEDALLAAGQLAHAAADSIIPRGEPVTLTSCRSAAERSISGRSSR